MFYTWFLLNLPSILLSLAMLMLITNTAKMGLESNEEKNKYYQSNVAAVVFLSIAIVLEKFYIPSMKI
jgi:uncharacterized oligopeptide transporter (OPT) family protein